MPKLLLIRHGKALLQDAGRFWGRTNLKLSDVGLQQAEQLGERLAKMKISAVYSSSLARASRTAEIIASRHRLAVQERDELCECNFGYVEGLTYDEITQRYPQLAGELMSMRKVAFPGGESLEQLNARILSFLKTLSDFKPDSTVAIVAHGGPLRLIICNLLGLDIDNWLKVQVDYASLSIVETYPRGATLSLLNDVSHLVPSGDS
jgi:alpha-ribazole phosphatase